MTAKEEKPLNKPASVVRTTTIVTIVIAFCVGIFSTLLFLSFLGEGQVTLSTTSIISFIFTVALGSASIILALIAINISRKAEDVIILRSDEGIRLQNEVFVRTTEVLSKIMASTGVTEKRIEDMISGRTMVIAKEVVEKSLPEREAIVTKEIAKKITSDIASSLTSELIPLISSPPSRAEKILKLKETKQKKQTEVYEKWKEFRTSVIDNLKGFANVEIIREIEGNLDSEDPAEFWDAILEIGGKRVGIDTHTEAQIAEGRNNFWKKNQSARIDFVRRLTWRIQQDAIPLAFVVSDENIWNKDVEISEIAHLFEEFNKKLPKFKVITLFGNPNSLAKQIHSISTTEKIQT